MIIKHEFLVSQNVFKTFKLVLITLVILHMSWSLHGAEYDIKNTFQVSHNEEIRKLFAILSEAVLQQLFSG